MNYRRETNINNQVFKCQKEVYKELDLNEQEKNISKFKMKHFLIFLVIGILFAGKNIAATEQQTNFIIILSILIALVMVVISTIVLTKFIKKIVKTPLSKVVALANNMENGEIGIANKDAVALTIHSEDEVGQVAYALSNTVNSLQTYVGEISTVLSAISAGNLSVQTEHEYYGDF